MKKLKCKSRATLTLEAILIFPLLFVVILTAAVNTLAPAISAYSTNIAYSQLSVASCHNSYEPLRSYDTGNIKLDAGVPIRHKDPYFNSGYSIILSNSNFASKYALSSSGYDLASKATINEDLELNKQITNGLFSTSTKLNTIGYKPAEVALKLNKAAYWYE